MTEISRPWQGIATGDSGPYSHTNWRDSWKYEMGLYDADAGVLVDSGTAPDTGLTVTQQSPLAAGITVTPGRALVQGTFYENTANLNLSIAPNSSGNTRIDSIILRRDDTAQTVRLAVLQGTPAASPVPPTLTRAGGVYEISIADVTVVNAFATISNSAILNRRMYSNVANGQYHTNVQNRSGGTLQTGDVVLWDTANDRAVVAPGGSTHTASLRVAGVWVGRTANLGYGRVLWRGIGLVKTTGLTTSRMVPLQQSATAKVAEAVHAPLGNYLVGGRQSFALTLEGMTASGYTLCLVDARPTNILYGDASVVHMVNNGNSTISSTSFTDVLLGGLTVDVYANVALAFVAFSAVVSHSVANSIIAFDLSINGTDYGATSLGCQDGLIRAPITTAGVPVGVSWAGLVPCAQGSASSIRLRWRTSGATATIYNAPAVAGQDVPVSLSVLNNTPA